VRPSPTATLYAVRAYAGEFRATRFFLVAFSAAGAMSSLINNIGEVAWLLP